MVDCYEIEIIKKIIAACSKSIETDVVSQGILCECGKPMPNSQINLWQPISRSDTYWIRNTLQSMLDCGLITNPTEKANATRS